MLATFSKRNKCFISILLVSSFLTLSCSKTSSTETGITDSKEADEIQAGQPPSTVIGTQVSVPCQSKRYFEYLNVYRRSLGLNTLAFSSKLFTASQWHAEDMSSHKYLDHADSLGRDPAKRAAAFGYSIRGAFGENIAVLSFSAAEKVFCAWKNSPGHHANMISRNYSGISVGFKTSADNVSHWSTAFTGVSAQGDFKTPKASEAQCAPIGALPGC